MPNTIHVVTVMYTDGQLFDEFKKEIDSSYDMIKIKIGETVVQIETNNKDDLTLFVPISRIKNITSVVIEE